MNPSNNKRRFRISGKLLPISGVSVPVLVKNIEDDSDVGDAPSPTTSKLPKKQRVKKPPVEVVSSNVASDESNKPETDSSSLTPKNAEDDLGREQSRLMREIESWWDTGKDPPKTLFESLWAVEEQIEKNKPKQEVDENITEHEEIPKQKTKVSIYIEPSKTAKRVLENTRQRKTLETLEPVSKSMLIGGNSDSFVQKWIFENGMAAVWKPEAGEGRYLVERVGGPLYQREATAADIAQIVGLGRLVPTTVVRQYQGDLGSLQTFVTDAVIGTKASGQMFGKSAKALAMAAAFDFWLGQIDRHADNWLVTKRGNLVLIDNGACLSHQISAESLELLQEAIDRKYKVPKEARGFADYWSVVSDLVEERGFSEEVVDEFRDRTKLLRDSLTFAQLREDAGRDLVYFS